MLGYVLKRLLIMIPTFIGVSFAIWLVMTMAPGKPSSQSGGSPMERAGNSDLGRMERQDLNDRIFKKQFALDRPRFINTWTGLTTNEVQAEIQVLLGWAREARNQAHPGGPEQVGGLGDLCRPAACRDARAY